MNLVFQPDREDECLRIEAAGGRVIKWDGYRVSGFLAVSRSIGMSKAMYIHSAYDLVCLQIAMKV